MNDSAVNSGNMPNPGDGGPGGGVIPQDGQTISYDANGNLISYKGWVYRYDAQNRLIYASNGTTSATFYYDGKNRQIARNINGVIRFNSWDSWELVEEYSSSLNVATGYLQGTTGVIKSWSAANTLYYYQDKLGSTTHVANASGQLVESYKYDLYGTPSYFNSTSQQLNSSTVGVTDLYAGERWIPELALYDLRNRFMSPELGRFLQTDPIGFKGDASNLYRYCGNDPVDHTDPSGLTMWGDLMKFFTGNPSMNLVQDAWNQQRSSGIIMAQVRNDGAGQSATEGTHFVPTKHSKDGKTAFPTTSEHRGDIYKYQLTRDGRRVTGPDWTVEERLKKNYSSFPIRKPLPEAPLPRSGIFTDDVGLAFRPSRSFNGSSSKDQSFIVKHNGQVVDVPTIFRQEVTITNGEVTVVVTVRTP